MLQRCFLQDTQQTCWTASTERAGTCCRQIQMTVMPVIQADALQTQQAESSWAASSEETRRVETIVGHWRQSVSQSRSQSLHQKSMHSSQSTDDACRHWAIARRNRSQVKLPRETHGGWPATKFCVAHEWLESSAPGTQIVRDTQQTVIRAGYINQTSTQANSTITRLCLCKTPVVSLYTILRDRSTRWLHLYYNGYVHHLCSSYIQGGQKDHLWKCVTPITDDTKW